MMTTDLHESVQIAMAHPDACAAVRDIYARLQLEIDRRKPVCVASGKCCHFEAYGHRLYVTTLELATFMLDLKESGSSEYLPSGLSLRVEDRDRLGGASTLQILPGSERCPLQRGKLCGVHAIRPFGCRIFFCDPTATVWQQEQYELFHRELKELHERFGVSYYYVEWKAALAGTMNDE